MITLEELSAAVSHTGENAIDTVVVGIVDMQGRLQGKRFHAQHFVDVVTREGTEGCNYLLAVDVDMNTVDGYAMSSWVRRIVRGDWTTGEWSSQTRSHCTIAVAGRWVSSRIVRSSITNSMSPYPRSQEEIE